MLALVVANFSDASLFIAITYQLFAGFRVYHLFALLLLICMLQLSSLLLLSLAPPNARMKVLRAVPVFFWGPLYSSSSSLVGSFLFLEWRYGRSNFLGLLLNPAGLGDYGGLHHRQGAGVLYGMIPWKGWPPLLAATWLAQCICTIDLAAISLQV